jgi:hypothetical protein
VTKESDLFTAVLYGMNPSQKISKRKDAEPSHVRESGHGAPSKEVWRKVIAARTQRNLQRSLDDVDSARLYRHIGEVRSGQKWFANKGEDDWRHEQTADPSTAPLAMNLREASLRMTSRIFISRLRNVYMSIHPRALQRLNHALMSETHDNFGAGGNHTASNGGLVARNSGTQHLDSEANTSGLLDDLAHRLAYERWDGDTLRRGDDYRAVAAWR